MSKLQSAEQLETTWCPGAHINRWTHHEGMCELPMARCTVRDVDDRAKGHHVLDDILAKGGGEGLGNVRLGKS